MRAEHFGLKKTILNILDIKWHEYFDVVESHFWCDKSGTKEQNTKSINVGILCVYQYWFINMARKKTGKIVYFYLFFNSLNMFNFIYLEFWLLFWFIADGWGWAIVSSGREGWWKSIKTFRRPKASRARPEHSLLFPGLGGSLWKGKCFFSFSLHDLHILCSYIYMETFFQASPRAKDFPEQIQRAGGCRHAPFIF